MFSQVVNLYRKLGKPSIDGEGAGFSYSGHAELDVLVLLKEMNELPDHFGSFTEKNIKANVIDIHFSLPSTDHGRFHLTIRDFLSNTPSLERGRLHEQYYICDLDWYSQDTLIHEKIKNLQKICDFIQLLSKLATDSSSLSDVAANNRLIFILAADGKLPSKTFAMRTKIEESALNISLSRLALLRDLLSEENNGQIHVEERCMIMRTAIAETLMSSQNTQNNFTYLMENWRDTIIKYIHNVQAFLNQYSFEKVRKEIATTEIEYATKISGVLGDIAGKLIALPVSLGGILLLRKAGTLEEFIVLALGLFIVSIIFGGILYNQWFQVKRLRGSYELIFGQYDDKLYSFPKKMQAPILAAKELIKHQGKILTITFSIFGLCTLIPIFGIIYIGQDKYQWWDTILWWAWTSCCGNASI
jgi:hypothetical protein